MTGSKQFKNFRFQGRQRQNIGNLHALEIRPNWPALIIKKSERIETLVINAFPSSHVQTEIPNNDHYILDDALDLLPMKQTGVTLTRVR